MEKENNDTVGKSSEEVQDIIERMPSRTGRTVSLIVIILAALLLFFGWLIEYPEKVSGPVSVTARQAPVKLVANSSGKLHLLKEIADTLNENEIIAYIDNPARLSDLLCVEKFLFNNDPEKLFDNPVVPEVSAIISLGELSMQYHSFLNAAEMLVQYRTQKPYEKKTGSLNSLLTSQLMTMKKNLEQLNTKENILRLAEKSVHRDSSLFMTSTIAEYDIDRSSVSYLGVLESKQALEKDNTTIGMQIEDTRSRMEMLALEKKDTEAKLKMDLIASYNELAAGIRKWKLTYCLISPIQGKLEYLNFWRENDFVMAGADVFSVLPFDNPILGQVYLPSQGAGKVAIGQEVIIKLDNYPYIEYGSINGRVRTISEMSNQAAQLSAQNKISTYLITVDLPLSLTTNYGSKLDFRYEIKGIADILIKKRKLLERLFDNLKYIVSEK